LSEHINNNELKTVAALLTKKKQKSNLLDHKIIFAKEKNRKTITWIHLIKRKFVKEKVKSFVGISRLIQPFLTSN